MTFLQGGSSGQNRGVGLRANVKDGGATPPPPANLSCPRSSKTAERPVVNRRVPSSILGEGSISYFEWRT